MDDRDVRIGRAVEFALSALDAIKAELAELEDDEERDEALLHFALSVELQRVFGRG